jgi:hypothetical protein
MPLVYVSQNLLTRNDLQRRHDFLVILAASHTLKDYTLCIEAQTAVRLYLVSQINASSPYNRSRCIGCPQTTLINTVFQSTYQFTVLVTKSSERILLYDITQNRFTAEGLHRPTLPLFGRTFIVRRRHFLTLLIHTGNYIYHLV